jgi:hypothetical protein
MVLKFVKLMMNYVLNRGVKSSDLTLLTLELHESMGTYTLGIGATVAIDPKTVLTPKENRRKKLIILFLISLGFMLGLSTIGAWLPDSQANLGRWLILLSEIPAFGYSLVSTRFLMKKTLRHNVAK